MAIIRNLASMMLKGKIGDTTYYVSQSRQLARQALNNSNYGNTASRTDVQQTRRVRWANLVNFYSGNKAWMKKAFENLKPGVSVFNRFMQLNIGTADIPLTKSQAQAKTWVFAPYRVSQGSLERITPNSYGDSNAARVYCDLQISQSTSIADLSEKILEANPTFLNGDAIVGITFNGTVGMPSELPTHKPATYGYSEFVIDTTDTRVFEEVYQGWGVAEGKIALLNAQDADGFVYIHTRRSAGKLYVSTENILLSDSVLEDVDVWKMPNQLQFAIMSYGESTSVPLAPGGSSSQQSGNDSSSGGGNNGGGTELE